MITERATKIGVLVPFTNTNLEPDMNRLCPKGATMHFARLGGYDVDEIPDSAQMAGLGASDISTELRLIAGVRPKAVLYGCTSATLTHGRSFDRDLAERIEMTAGAKSITAAGALEYALARLAITRIGFASPYVGEINHQAMDFLTGAGVETLLCADIGKSLGNYGQGELTPTEVLELARRADHPDAQAIVLSCTDMRSVEIIEALEAEIGKPVITSNQAMIFQLLEVLDLSATDVMPGRLFDLKSD